MKLETRWLPQLLLCYLTMVLVVPRHTVAADQLDEKTLITLIRFADDDDVVSTIQENGVAFEVDDAVMERLRDANAGEAVLQAVRSAAAQARPAEPTGPTITYGDVLALVKSGVPDRVILRSISNSPTLFTLGADQERELRNEGASDAVIVALKGEQPRQAQTVGEPTQRTIQILAIVLDYSNSMNDETTDGELKIDVAKERVCELVRGIPDELDVTVIVYGHRGNPRPCQAVEVIRNLAPLGVQGRAQLIRDIQRRQAVGKTPIALALRTARDVLATRDARCGLILISDGMETCDGDPTAEAAALASNLNVTFARVVGFDVDAKGRDQLDDTASAMGGEYLSASSAEEFEDVIEDVQSQLDRAVEQPAVVPTPSLVSAIMIEPWNLEGFPRLQELLIYKTGANSDPVKRENYELTQRVTNFRNAIPLSAGTYDLWYRAEGVPLIVKLGEFELAARTTLTLKGNRLVAGISVPKPRLDGLGDLEAVGVVPAGRRFGSNEVFQPTQFASSYDTPMLVTADAGHDVYLKVEGGEPVFIQEDVSVRGGELVVIGGEDSGDDPFAGAESGNE